MLRPPLAPALVLVFTATAICGIGCFSQQSYPMDPHRVRVSSPERLFAQDQPPAARAWAEVVHCDLADTLPPSARPAVTSKSLREPLDVYRKFGLSPDAISGFFGNLAGLVCSARVSDFSPAAFGDIRWDGFEAIRLEVEPGVRLYGQISHPPVHFPRRDYIVVVHGLFGHLGEVRYRDLATALASRGYGVLAVEMRGHGRTDRLHPEAPMTFGLLEARDLRRAAAFLRTEHDARRVGLIGFSIGGFQSLLAAAAHDPTLGDEAQVDEVKGGGQHPADGTFDAGVMAFSPVIDPLGLAERFNSTPHLLANPTQWTIQNLVSNRLVRHGCKQPSRSLWDLFDFEIGRSRFKGRWTDRDDYLRRGLTRIDLRGPEWSTGVRRLESLRVPTLIVHAADDPVTPAQMVVELASRVSNPNVGVLILGQGGHTGLPVVSADYYYSLILSFFDPRTGPRAAPDGDIRSADRRTMKASTAP